MDHFPASKPEANHQPSYIELESAVDLADKFNNLRHSLDKHAITPNLEVSTYEFDKNAILYSYPPQMRALLDLYDSDIEKLSVTIDNRVNSPLIRATTDNLGILEIAPLQTPEGEVGYTLSSIGSSIDLDNVDLSPESVGDLLLSLALSPDAAAYIDTEKRNNQKIEKLDPRGLATLLLLENNLKEQADFAQTIQLYQLEYETNDDSSYMELDLYVTQQKPGVEAYDTTLTEYYCEEGLAELVKISARCAISVDSKFETMIRGAREISTLDRKQTQHIDKISCSEYLNSALAAIAKNPKPLKTTKLSEAQP